MFHQIDIQIPLIMWEEFDAGKSIKFNIQISTGLCTGNVVQWHLAQFHGTATVLSFKMRGDVDEYEIDIVKV